MEAAGVPNSDGMTCNKCDRTHWVWRLDDPDWSCPCGAPVDGDHLEANFVEKMWYLSPPLGRLAMALCVVGVSAAIVTELIYSLL